MRSPISSSRPTSPRCLACSYSRRSWRTRLRKETPRCGWSSTRSISSTQRFSHLCTRRRDASGYAGSPALPDSSCCGSASSRSRWGLRSTTRSLWSLDYSATEASLSVRRKPASARRSLGVRIVFPPIAYSCSRSSSSSTLVGVLASRSIREPSTCCGFRRSLSVASRHSCSATLSLGLVRRSQNRLARPRGPRREPFLPPIDRAPRAVLPAGVEEFSDVLEAVFLVQRDARVVGQRDAGDRGAITASRELVEQRVVEPAAEAAPTRVRRDV